MNKRPPLQTKCKYHSAEAELQAISARTPLDSLGLICLAHHFMDALQWTLTCACKHNNHHHALVDFYAYLSVLSSRPAGLGEDKNLLTSYQTMEDALHVLSEQRLLVQRL